MPPKRAIGADDGGVGRSSKKQKTAPANRARVKAANKSRNSIKVTPTTFKSTKTDRRQREKQDKKAKVDASAIKAQDSKPSGGEALAEKSSKLILDTKKANEEQLQQAAPNSVGPPYTPLLTVANDVQKLVRKNRQQGGSKPAGISNKSGNHCYRNAVLTMLLYSKPFMAYVSSTKDNEPDLPESESRGKFLLRRLRSMAEAVNKGEPELQKGLDKAVKHFWKTNCFPKTTGDTEAQSQVPMKSWAGLRKDKDSVATYTDSHEEDAAEFLGWILETIYDQLEHYEPGDSFDEVGRSNEQRSFDWLLSMSKAGRVVCSKCSWRVKRRVNRPRERLWLLTLPESSTARDTKATSTSRTLVDLIQDDMQATLSGAQCPRCNRKDADLERYEDIKQAPEILFICIGRYKAREVTLKRGDSFITGVKDLDVVVIPEELDLSDFLNRHDYGEKSVVEYRLSGVVSHAGQYITSGHYHSFVRGGLKGEQWYRINDSRVNTCDLKEFDDSKANEQRESKFKTRFTPYILMYEINPQKSKSTPGRAAQNVGEGDRKDERPTTWTGGHPREQTPGMAVPTAPQPVVPTVPSPRPAPTTVIAEQQSTMPSLVTHVPGLESEADCPQARLDITVNLGDKDDNFITTEIPPTFISDFDRNKPRTEISIKATLTAPKARTSNWQATSADRAGCVELELVDRLLKEEIEQYWQTEAMNEARKKWQSQGLQGNELRKARSEFWNSWRKKWPLPDWTSEWKDVDVPAGADVTDGADTSEHHSTPSDDDASSDTIVIDTNNYEGMVSRSSVPTKTRRAKASSQSIAAGRATSRGVKDETTKTKPAPRSSSDKAAPSTNLHRSKRQPSSTARDSPARKTEKGLTSTTTTTTTTTKNASVKSTDAKPSGVRKSSRATRKPARFEGE